MFVCLDIETTGLNPQKDHVIEVAIVRFDEEKIHEEWQTLINPGVPIPAFSTHLTGITNEMVKDAPTLKEMLATIEEKIGDNVIVGHYIFFDTNFLTEKGAKLPNKTIDTCQMAQAIMPREKSYSLEVLTKKLGIMQENAHRAMNDVKANIELFWLMGEHIKALPKDSKEAIEPILKKGDFGIAETFLQLLKEDGGKLIPEEIIEEKPVYETHANLAELTKDLKEPFLFEEGSHTDLDLINYSLSLNGKTLLVMPNVDDFSSNKDMEIIKHPNQYLDQNRFKEFLNKETLTVVEILLGVKIALWLKYTKTGEKSELRLLKEENDFWFNICAEENTESDFFKKALKNADQKKLTILNHLYFLKNAGKKNPQILETDNTVIGHTEDLVETLEIAWHMRFTESRFTQDLKALGLEDLSSRISILFGLIGMFWQKNAEAESLAPLTIEKWHLNTNEWDKVKNSALAIEKDLATIKNQELARTLLYFTKILRTGDPALWLTLTPDGNPIVHSFPELYADIFKDRVWANTKNARMFCHHGNLKNDFEFFKKELALPDDLETVSTKDIYPLPLDFPKNRISGPNDPKNISEVVHQMAVLLPEITGNIILEVSSKVVAEQFFYKLADAVKNAGRKLFVQNLNGGMGKILKMSQATDGQNVFIGNADFLEFLIKDNVNLSFLAIHRLPFTNPEDPIKVVRSKRYENAYKQFALPYASIRFHKILDTFLGNNWEGKRILVLDPRITDYEEWFN
ncbi:MAG: exonuclease domain-containing protein [Candidatus Gracilibacteria bacterium]